MLLLPGKLNGPGGFVRDNPSMQTKTENRLFKGYTEVSLTAKGERSQTGDKDRVRDRRKGNERGVKIWMGHHFRGECGKVRFISSHGCRVSLVSAFIGEVLRNAIQILKDDKMETDRVQENPEDREEDKFLRSAMHGVLDHGKSPIRTCHVDRLSNLILSYFVAMSSVKGGP
jgi:hypothetical protein